MAQELKQIIDLLKEMKTANNTNTKSFDRLLASISNKLDMMEGNSASEELIKAYWGELTKTVYDKYNMTLAKFSDIEKALRAVYEVQNEHVKNNDFKDLFEIFTKNMNGFYTEAKQQKAILAGLEAKLYDFINNKSDKDDILRTITLLRGDFENLNHAYKSTIDNINQNLKSILSGLINMDQTNLGLSIKDEIAVMHRATDDIVNYLRTIHERDLVLEKLLANVATNESLKLTQGVIDSIIEKSEEISQRIVNLADKSDVEGLQTAAAIINNKVENVLTKEEFAKITIKTDDLVSQADEVKQTLAKVTQDIEAIPNTKLLEKSLQKLFKKLDSLAKDISKANVKGDVFDIDNKLNVFKDELATIKNIVVDLNEITESKVLSTINDISFAQESNDIKNHVSEMLKGLPQKEDINKILLDSEKNSAVISKLIERTDNLADRLDSLPTHKDIAALNSNQVSLVENLQGIPNKEDIERLSAKADEIEEMIDKLNFDSEFENIYDRTSSLQNWLEESKISEHAREIYSQLPQKADQKDVLTILQTTEKIVKGLEELSHNTDAKKVTRTVAELYGMIDDLKNDLISTEEMHNDSILVQLAELKNSVSGLTTGEEFGNFAEDLKDFTEKVARINEDIYGNISENQVLQKEIMERIENIDFSYVIQNINANFESLNEAMQDSIAESNREVSRRVSDVKNRLVSMSEYINSGLKVNEGEIKRAISEIKEILLNKKSNFDGIGFERSHTSDSVSNYLVELRELLDTSNKGLTEELKAQFLKIESDIERFKSLNDNQFAQIIERLEHYESSTVRDNTSTEDFEASISEITEIKSMMKGLGDSFNDLNAVEGSPERRIAVFVNRKLRDLTDNLEEMATNITNGIQQGFAYNSELIEEKTNALSDLIRDLRHSSTDNIEMYERLTVTDNKLIDFKQELELLSTDVISNFTEKTDRMIKELAPIKEMISCLAIQMPDGSAQNEKVKEQLGILHSSVQEDLIECTKYSKSTYERLEAAYSHILDQLSDSEKNIKDFILGDIDSVIIKIDNLESSLAQITPPSAEQMAEFNEFVSQIHQFRDEQKEFLNAVAEDIKVTITEKLTEHHNEIKSMLSVIVNNDEILQAIDELKRSFRARVNDLTFNSDKVSQAQASDAVFSANEFEEVFEESDNDKIISDIKDDFSKFASLITDLSGDNEEIQNVLATLLEKIDTLNPTKVKKSELQNIQSSDEKDFDSIAIVEDNEFDFIKAFDLLKQDIKNLRNDIEKVLPPDLKVEDLNAESVNMFDNELLLTLSDKVDGLVKYINTDWLDEIKTYIAGNDIQAKLEEINEKIDFLSLSDHSDWVDEIKKVLNQLNTNDLVNESSKEIQAMLGLINDKIDILADSTPNIDLMENVKDTIENLHEKESKNQAARNNEIKEIIESLNFKIDDLAAADTSLDIQDIKETINELGNKIEILDNVDNIEDIKYTLVDVNEKINSIISDDTSKNSLAELKVYLDAIDEKVDLIVTDDTNEQAILELRTYLSTIEDKINAVLSDNTTKDTADELKTYLDTIDAKIDLIAETSNYDESLSELQDALNEVSDSINLLKPVDEKVAKLSDSDVKMTSMLEILNHKIDSLAKNQEDDGEFSKQSVDDVKHLILAQMNYIEKLERNNKTDAFRKCLHELTYEVNNLNLNSNSTTKQIQKTLKDMKDSIMDAVVTIFQQVSFIEESEDIKEFVEEKTDVINQNLEEVTKQLKQITNSVADPEYTYSMQDIESDLAKLRLALNEIQDKEKAAQAVEFANITTNLNKITSSVEELQNSLTQDEIKDLKIDIFNLQEQTQRLLISSGESYNALNSGLEDFGRFITDNLSYKVDHVTRMLEKSSDSDKVMRQALIYMGEWIDSASESMNKISTNSDEIIDMKSIIQDLKASVPEQTDILNSIEEKFDEQQERLSFFEKQISKLAGIEEKFEQQQERIDRLEMAIEKVLTAVEDIDDSKVTRKIDKIDKQLAKLSTNIEKLASYVD